MGETDKTLIDYKIVIPGEPIKKERHRTVYKDRNGKALPFPRTYNPQEDEQAKYRWAVIQYLTKTGTGLFLIKDCPIAMGLTYVMPIRKNWAQYKIRDLKRGMTFYHYKKPDLDNLIKFTKDALEGLCYDNDSQVAIMDPPPIKSYGLEPKTIVQIRTLPKFEMVQRYADRREFEGLAKIETKGGEINEAFVSSDSFWDSMVNGV